MSLDYVSVESVARGQIICKKKFFVAGASNRDLLIYILPKQKLDYRLDEQHFRCFLNFLLPTDPPPDPQ